MNLLAVAHNYRSQGKRVILLKPRLDTRWGQDVILSRSGLEAQADLLVDSETVLATTYFEGLDCVLVDEAQFLSIALVDQLRKLTLSPGIPVICYGLRTDFQTHLFDGSRRLFEVADSIEEVKVTCKFCNRKAIFNMRLIQGRPTAKGAQIELGGDDKYIPTCACCYQTQLSATAST